MDDPLDIDSFDVENWHSLCLSAISMNKKKQFVKKITAYIYLTNNFAHRELNQYINMRNGNFLTQKTMEKNGISYQPEWPR